MGEDALKQLIRCLQNGLEVRIEPDGVVLDQMVFPRNSNVALRSPNHVPYKLETCIHAHRLRHVANSDYIRLSRSEVFERVEIPRRADIAAYLSGETSHIPELGEPVLVEPLRYLSTRNVEKKLRTGFIGNDTESISANEKIYRDRTSSLLGSQKLDRILAIIGGDSSQTQGHPPVQTQSQNIPGQVPNVSNRTSTPNNSGRQEPPIIIVPAALSGHITLYNVKKFLEEGKFEETQEVRKTQPKKPDAPVHVTFTRGSKKTVFHLYDSFEKFTEDKWKNQVVAIFTNGKEWELKGILSGNPVEVFARFRGFHLAMETEKLREPITKWDVKILRVSLSSSKRYLDGEVKSEFWAELERFMSSKFPQFLR